MSSEWKGLINQRQSLDLVDQDDRVHNIGSVFAYLIIKDKSSEQRNTADKKNHIKCIILIEKYIWRFETTFCSKLFGICDHPWQLPDSKVTTPFNFRVTLDNQNQICISKNVSTNNDPIFC